MSNPHSLHYPHSGGTSRDAPTLRRSPVHVTMPRAARQTSPNCRYCTLPCNGARCSVGAMPAASITDAAFDWLRSASTYIMRQLTTQGGPTHACFRALKACWVFLAVFCAGAVDAALARVQLSRSGPAAATPPQVKNEKNHPARRPCSAHGKTRPRGDSHQELLTGHRERVRNSRQKHPQRDCMRPLAWGSKASLAQLVEHALRKRMVMGSSPIGGYYTRLLQIRLELAEAPARGGRLVLAASRATQPPTGLEPMTVRLQSACSTSWAKEALQPWPDAPRNFLAPYFHCGLCQPSAHPWEEKKGPGQAALINT